MPYIGNEVGNRFVASKAASVYSGNGSTTAFTLEHAVGSDEDILVSVDGVIQEPSVAYAVSSGTTLTFTAAPSSNSGNNIFVYYLFRTVGTIDHPATSALSATSGTFSGNLVIPDAGNIGSASDTDAIAISSGGVVTFSQTPVGAFISEYDIHRITTNTDNTADAYVTANWERCDDAEFEKIGTGLSQSSGIFTFPSTGKYLITAFVTIQARNNTVPQGKTNLYTTTDNSTYVVSAVAEMHGAADQVTTVSMSILFDVTNTTTHKVRLGLITAANAIRALGSSAENRTYITFMKIGAT